MTKMELIRNLAQDFNIGELYSVPVEAVQAVPCNLIPKPTQVIFNPPATIVYWEDGDKTVVRCDNDVFSEEFGYAMACMRKAYGSRANFKAQFKNAFRPQQKPKKSKKSKDSDQKENVAALPSSAHNVIGLDKMIKQLAGDDSMGVRVGYRVKENE